VRVPRRRTRGKIDFVSINLVRYCFRYECHRSYRTVQSLPSSERAQVAKFVVENDDSWIPESFKQGMADAEAGRFVDLDTALNEPYPGCR
jgi:hypothetical protein